MGGWGQDLRFACRTIIAQRGTSAMAVVALALGIGLTAVMFSIVQGVILRGLPFDDAERIQHLTLSSPGNARGRSVSVHTFVDWRTRQQSFESLEAYNSTTLTVTGGGGLPEDLRGARLTPGLFTTLRVQPILGRPFTEADAVPGAPAVMVIGHTLWQLRFQSRPDVVGQVLRVNGVQTEIIGVMPPRFGFPNSHNAWIPMVVSPPENRSEGMYMAVVGRLKPGVTGARATTELAGITAQLALQHAEYKDTRPSAGPFIREALGNDVISMLMTMMVAVFGVMLIACVNVTNLQLARAAGRTREVAIRVAIGASRWQVVRQTLVEGLVLSAAGAVVGLAIAWTGTTLFSRAIVDTQPPFWIDVRLDPIVVGFVMLTTIAAALVSSLVPGWRLARTDVNHALKDEGRGTTSLRMGRFSRWLVVTEVTVSCILLVVSGLMVRSIVQSGRLDAPYATEDVFVADLVFDSRVFPTRADIDRGHAQMDELLRRIPGVRAVAYGSGPPQAGGGAPLSIDGRVDESPEQRPRALQHFGSAEYFDVLRVTPTVGRVFTAADDSAAQPVAIVDESFAKLYLPDGAVGRRIRFGADDAPWMTIVGVVPALAAPGPSGTTTATVFRPTTQSAIRGLTLLVSTRGEPMSITAAVREAVAQVGEGLPLNQPGTLAGRHWEDAWPVRVFGGLFMAFGVAALVLASAGLYGVMAFAVRQRTQEIGVRMAMGAARGAVLRMVLWQGLWRVGLATLVGLVPGWQAGRLFGVLLRDVSPGDPLVLSLTAATLMISGTLACLAPALRAASVDPVVALRGE